MNAGTFAKTLALATAVTAAGQSGARIAYGDDAATKVGMASMVVGGVSIGGAMFLGSFDCVAGGMSLGSLSTATRLVAGLGIGLVAGILAADVGAQLLRSAQR